MKKDAAQKLMLEGKKYLGQTIDVKIFNSNMELTKTVPCKFIRINSVSISENNEEPNIDLYAILTDLEGETMIYPISLQNIVNQLKEE
ncbi:hypothetical protein [Paraflavitalea sp. CAU 1676]|uniref:hypothetical protein n=1 Tax=Paraflavitalea sp. CAU 1676 TaxID=3032598 RepID=UPI0023D9A14A|nr:hypothetical protein [Paraflavitalea sp. CAU 1676]MDF2192569.1 hypothetical protein [Paraflavitalea sp. CAU 1676]